MRPNDPKLRDCGARRGSCTVGLRGAATVTRGAVLCSAWLGVAVESEGEPIHINPLRNNGKDVSNLDKEDNSSKARPSEVPTGNKDGRIQSQRRDGGQKGTDRRENGCAEECELLGVRRHNEIQSPKADDAENHCGYERQTKYCVEDDGFHCHQTRATPNDPKR